MVFYNQLSEHDINLIDFDVSLYDQYWIKIKDICIEFISKFILIIINPNLKKYFSRGDNKAQT